MNKTRLLSMILAGTLVLTTPVNIMAESRYSTVLEDGGTVFSEHGEFYNTSMSVVEEVFDAAAAAPGDSAWFDPESEQFTLTSYEQLQAFAMLVNTGTSFEGKTVMLGNNIQCEGIFPRIGISNAFDGVFDGCGYEISNVYFSSSLAKHTAALFVATTADAQIKNLTVSGTLEGVKCGVVGSNLGVISNVTSKLRIFANGYGGGIANENKNRIENCSFYGSIENEWKFDLLKDDNSPTTGGICGTNAKDAVIEGCKSFGSVTGRGNVGGITAVNNGQVSTCSNYGVINNDGVFSGGIAAQNTSVVTGCVNYADVNNTGNNSAGIAGYNTGSISNSNNRGNISGKANIGGIVGQNNATVKLLGCSNSGSVTASANCVGGVCGYNAYNYLTIEKCVNYGNITSLSNNDADDVEVNNGNAGGIIGYSLKSFTVLKCANYGSVVSEKSNCGGIAGKIRGNSALVSNCLSVGDCRCNTLEENGTARPCANIAANYTGRINYSLGIGAPGSVYKSGSSSNVTGSSAFSDISAAGLIDETVFTALSADANTDSSWVQGEKYPYIQELGDIEGLVTTEQELISALAGGNEIVLGASINPEVALSINGDASINGNGHTIGGVITAVDGSITINDARVGGLNISGADVTLENVISDNTIVITSGTLAVDSAAVASQNVPVVNAAVMSAVSGMEKYYAEDGQAYVANPVVWDSTTAVEVVIPASGNSGIPYDLRPYFSEDTCYFMLPYTAAASSITFKTLNVAGEMLAEYNTDTALTVEVKGTSYNITLLKNEIPAMYLNIDESQGLINDMNTSYDHEALCYGTFDLQVPEAIALERGWETSYTDSSIEMRGRGNNSWRHSRTMGSMTPYQVKLKKKNALLGMGKGKSWTLLATQQNQGSSKYLNNAVSYNVAKDMGVKYQPGAEEVNVFLNGDYIGLYTLAEKVQIGDGRIEITDMEDAIDSAIEAGDTSLDTVDKTGGYLLEIDNNADEFQFANGQGQKLTIKSPENLDTSATGVTGARYDYIKDLMKDFFAAVYGDGYMTYGENAGKHFTEIVDMDSLVTYLWSAELLSVNDFSLGSTYIYKDSDAVDGRLKFGPLWDCDTAFNANYTWQWMLPIRTGYSGEKVFVNALLDHKEIASYMAEYYKNNYRNIRTVFAGYEEKAVEMKEYCQESVNMSDIRYDYSGKDISSDIERHITTKLDWTDNNIDTLVTQAEKGKIITEVPNPVEPPKPEKPIQAGDLITGFKFAGGVEEQDFEGDPEAGYNSNAGAASKLYASANGTNARKLKWSKAEYGDNGTDAVPVLTAEAIEEVLPWGEHPYFTVKTSTVGYTNVKFSAELGGSKKGAANFNLEYSLDGQNFKLIKQADKITSNKKLFKTFENVELPAEADNCEEIYFRIIARDGAKIAGATPDDLFPGTTSGEIAINNIMIYGDNGVKVDVSYDNGNLSYTMNNTTDKDLGVVSVYAASYNADGTLIGVAIESENMGIGAVETGVLALADSEYVKLMLWDGNNKPIKTSIIAK